jgi:hypothetical protein
MRIKVLVIVGLVLWGWSGVPAFAQYLDLPYVTKDNVGIVIETVTSTARNCGITESSLDAAVRLPLSRNGFVLKPDADDTFLVNTTVLQHFGGCAVYVSFQFMKRVWVTPNSYPFSDDWNLRKIILGAKLWQRGTLLNGPNVEMGRAVTSNLEGFTKQWIAQWLIDNPQ